MSKRTKIPKVTKDRDGVPYQVARIVMKACRHPAQARLFDPEFLKKITGQTNPVS